MKLRKILSAVVAGALFASLAVGASAEKQVISSGGSSETYAITELRGAITFAELDFSNKVTAGPMIANPSAAVDQKFTGTHTILWAGKAAAIAALDPATDAAIKIAKPTFAGFNVDLTKLNVTGGENAAAWNAKTLKDAIEAGAIDYSGNNGDSSGVPANIADFGTDPELDTPLTNFFDTNFDARFTAALGGAVNVFKFEGTLTSTDTGSKLNIQFGQYSNFKDIAGELSGDAVYLALSAVKLNGVQLDFASSSDIIKVGTEAKAVYYLPIAKLNASDLASSNTTLKFSVSSGLNQFIFGKIKELTFSADAVITKAATSDTDGLKALVNTKDSDTFAGLGDKGKQLNMGVTVPALALQEGVRMGDAAYDPAATADLSLGNANMKIVDSKEGTKTTAAGKTIALVKDNKLSLAQKAGLQKANGATLALTFKEVKDATIVKVTLNDSAKTVLALQMLEKDQKDVSFNVPLNYFYDATYGAWNDGAYGEFTIDCGSLEISAAEIFFDDGAAAPAGNGEDELGDDDDDASAAIEDDDTALEDDDDEDLGDDDDEDFGDDDDDDFGTDGDDSAASNGNANEGTDGAGDTNSGDSSNAKTGVAIAVVPALVAGAAVVFSRKRK